MLFPAGNFRSSERTKSEHERGLTILTGDRTEHRKRLFKYSGTCAASDLPLSRNLSDEGRQAALEPVTDPHEPTT